MKTSLSAKSYSSSVIREKVKSMLPRSKSKVFNAVLEHNTMTGEPIVIRELVNKAKVSRTLIYSIVKDLEKSGLIVVKRDSSVGNATIRIFPNYSNEVFLEESSVKQDTLVNNNRSDFEDVVPVEGLELDSKEIKDLQDLLSNSTSFQDNFSKFISEQKKELDNSRLTVDSFISNLESFFDFHRKDIMEKKISKGYDKKIVSIVLKLK